MRPFTDGMARRNRGSRHPDFPEAPLRRGFFGRPTLAVFWVFVVAACLAVAIPAIPQYRLLQSIEKEVDDSKKLFKRYNWPTIDVTRKSVEETAASIIKIYDIQKSK